MNLFAIAGLSCGIACTILALVAIVYGKGLLQRILALFNTAVAIWGFGCYMVGVSSTGAQAILGWRIAHIGGVFVAVFFYHMVIVFCELNRKIIVKIIYFAMTCALILDILSDVFINKTRYVFDLYYNDVTFVYVAIIVFWFSLVILGFYELLKFLRRATGIRLIQANYIIAGFLTGFLGGASTFLPEFKIDIFYPFGNFSIPVYCLISTYAILRYHLMELRVAISRTAIFLIIYTFIIGIPFYLWHKNPTSVIPFLLMFVLSTIGPIIYKILQNKTENIILAEQRRYQKILIQAANGMTNEHDIKKLLKLICYVISKTVKIDFTAIFLKDNGGYSLKAIRDHASISANLTLLIYDPAIVLAKDKKIKIDDVYEKAGPLIQKHFTRPVGLVVPAYMDKELIGLLVLGEKRNKSMYTQDDINVFKILADHASLAISNCIYMAEYSKEKDKSFAAQRRVWLLDMMGGIVHRVRNVLNNVQMTLYKLTDKNDGVVARIEEGKFDEVKEILKDMSVINEMKDDIKNASKMITGATQLVQGTNIQERVSCTHISELFGASIQDVKTKYKTDEIYHTLEIPVDYMIYCGKARLRSVLGTVIGNAYMAVCDRRTELSEEERECYNPQIIIKIEEKTDTYLISVIDNGIGIHESVRQNVFLPFHGSHSERAGQVRSGMGLYTSRFIVEDHDGNIWFMSEYMKGTTFYIELPKGPPPTEKTVNEDLREA